MKAPTQIKRALKCLTEEAEENMCASCAYRHERDCKQTVLKDVQEYMGRLEQMAEKERTGREGRIRNVYLYTIIDQNGETVCKDATVHEAKQAMGYDYPQAITRMYQQYQSGMRQGYSITRKKGVVGKQLPPEEREPNFVYDVADIKGRKIAAGINRRDLADFLGLSVSGVQSMYRKARASGHESRVEYKGYILLCRRTARGERCYPEMRG